MLCNGYIIQDSDLKKKFLFLKHQERLNFSIKLTDSLVAVTEKLCRFIVIDLTWNQVKLLFSGTGLVSGTVVMKSYSMRKTPLVELLPLRLDVVIFLAWSRHHFLTSCIKCKLSPIKVFYVIPLIIPVICPWAPSCWQSPHTQLTFESWVKLRQQSLSYELLAFRKWQFFLINQNKNLASLSKISYHFLNWKPLDQSKC